MTDGPYVLTKDKLLGDVAIESPEAAELLAQFGLHCISCFANSFDTLELGARIHGMDDNEVDDMVAEINKELENKFKAILIYTFDTLNEFAISKANNNVAHLRPRK